MDLYSSNNKENLDKLINISLSKSKKHKKLLYLNTKYKSFCYYNIKKDD